MAEVPDRQLDVYRWRHEREDRALSDAPGPTPDTRFTNWAIVSRIADGEITPAPIDSWSRMGRMDEVIPYARRFNVPDVDVEALVRSTSVCWEYPMCDRDPLPHWSYGRVTLLGDSAHPIPGRLNGAAQAILARSLADWLRKPTTGCRLAMQYERERFPRPRRSCALNRRRTRCGSTKSEKPPGGLESVERVLSHAEREAIASGYVAQPASLRAVPDDAGCSESCKDYQSRERS
jgi:hypothetical protein